MFNVQQSGRGRGSSVPKMQDKLVLKDLLVYNFDSFTVKYGPRECNRVAHELLLL